MLKAFKYRIEPSANQERELAITLETHRRLYNACLEQRKTAYETESRSIRYTEQSSWFKTERSTNPWFARLNFSSAQATMRRLDKAFQAFFQRIKTGKKPGYPRFKGRDRFDSFTYPSIGDGARLINRKLRLQHIGLIRVNLHRPTEGTAKTIAISRESGKWYAIIVCEVVVPRLAVSDKPPVGIDVGLESFLTTSDGLQIAPCNRSSQD